MLYQLQSVIAAVILSGGALCAQDVLTLDDAIAIALANNYDILLSKNDSAVAALDYSYRDVVFYPRVNATLGSTWTSNNQKQRYTSGNDSYNFV